jgi:lipopolysaccharide export system permease protein
MRIFDGYVFRNLLIATVFIAVTLAVVILLTQSLRFLELVINSGASSISFWILTLLALPRFFEIILPLSLMAATIFIYNRMTMDSELVAVRSVGYSPMALAKPALVLAMIVTVFLWGITMWAAPKSLASMQEMRQVIKAQFSAFLFREGVFNQVGSGLTVYMHGRTRDGELRGMMIHDSREKTKNPSTILAKRGVIVATDEGHQVVVYDGSRQEYDPEKRILQRLNFERYTIDLPDSGPVRKRWREPDERTIGELMNPNLSNIRDIQSQHEFHVEIHRRIIAPMMALAFTLISCCALLLGPTDRRGQGWRIVAAIGAVVVLQGLFLGAFSIARQSLWGLGMAYIVVLGPLGLSLFILSDFGERFRQRLFFVRRQNA